ncbi:tubulin epsilon chain-like [Cimex lectularius]|uniref:Tubulin/FtsZ GTPase domain-containing protein n=1 Tax=Cimex lectularius TaxID=79782 RepID=A0A8I6S2T6_CIMLE|nr:tubulin epsilon chain-like [Cimex lectularius]
MSEFLTIQVGQCGNQIGHAFWPMILQEHGMYDSNRTWRRNQDEALHSFFYNPKNVDCHTIEQMVSNKVKARALLIDMENSVVERFHNSRLRDIFDRACTLFNYPGSGNNWAVGHFTHGNEQKSTIRNMIRASVEKCDRLHGFISLFSLGGGTGSGLGSAVQQMLYDDYTKVDRIVSCVHPGENNDVVTSPYNIAFSLKCLKEYTTCVLPIDNKALLDICNRIMVTKDMATWEPYRNMNNIIVKMLLHFTSGARFPGPLNFDISDLSTNLVPFPGLHFLASSLSPIMFSKEKDVGVIKRQNDLVLGICGKDNQLLSINATKGTVFSAALFGRGDISLSCMRNYVKKFEENVKFTSWSYPGVKTSLCTVPTHNCSKSLLCLTNTTEMMHFFQKTKEDFDRLLNKKAHIHHYTRVDGFDRSEFSNTRECLSEIIDCYLANNREITIPRFYVAL